MAKVFNAASSSQFSRQRRTATVICPEFDPDAEFRLEQPSARLMVRLFADMKVDSEVLPELARITLVDEDGNNYLGEDEAYFLFTQHLDDLKPLVDAIYEVSDVVRVMKMGRSTQAKIQEETGPPSLPS